MDTDFTGTYPIIIAGEEKGKLEVERQGLFWCFEARSEMCEGIVRLSVFGGGDEGYLGVMAPENSGLALHKKLSRTSLMEFPKEIEYCAEKGYTPPPDTDIPPSEGESAGEENVSAEEEPESDDAPEKAEFSPDIPPPAEIVFPEDEVPAAPPVMPVESKSDSISPQINMDKPNIGGIIPQESEMPPPCVELSPRGYVHRWYPCPNPCSLFSGMEQKSICGEIKNALVAKNGDVTLLAVPLSSVNGLEKRGAAYFSRCTVIRGITYVVCRIKNGKPI